MNRMEEKMDTLAKEDHQLIHDFLAKDPRAFDKLVLKHQNTVFNLCFSMLGNYDDAADCAQETFIKVYRALQDFKGNAKFTTWLYRITVNTCKNKLASAEYRHRKKTIAIDGSPQPGNALFIKEIADESNTPANAFEKKATAELILEAIRSLPQSQKVLVVLCDIEGRSYDELAKITGLPLGTVKSKLARARHQLRSKLEEMIVNEMP